MLKRTAKMFRQIYTGADTFSEKKVQKLFLGVPLVVHVVLLGVELVSGAVPSKAPPGPPSKNTDM